MILRIPPGLDPALDRLFREIDDALRKVSGPNNVDFHGRRIMNAGDAVDLDDYVTLRNVHALLEKFKVGKSSSILSGAQGSGSGSGSGGGGGGTVGTPTGWVALYDGSSIVDSYAASHPTELANSCQDSGGTWDFMDGVIRDLQAADSRFGYNAKRGNVNDPSKDAISYYAGPLSSMSAGAPEVYVIDIIGGHCGPNPSAVWQNVTGQGGAKAGWLPTR